MGKEQKGTAGANDARCICGVSGRPERDADDVRCGCGPGQEQEQLMLMMLGTLANSRQLMMFGACVALEADDAGFVCCPARSGTAGLDDTAFVVRSRSRAADAHNARWVCRTG